LPNKVHKTRVTLNHNYGYASESILLQEALDILISVSAINHMGTGSHHKKFSETVKIIYNAELMQVHISINYHSLKS